MIYYMMKYPSTIVLDSWYEVFVLLCYVWFSPNVLLCIMTKHLYFGLICPNVIVPEVLMIYPDAILQT